jgi:cellulose synthase operon protein B
MKHTQRFNEDRTVISLIIRALLAASLVVLTASVDAQQRRPLGAPFESGRISPPPQRAAVILPTPQSTLSQPPIKTLLVGVPFADVGFPDGFRLSNLGGRREVYVPVPQGIELNLGDLVLAYDDISAHDARRSLEILVNDRSVAALALDGKSSGRTVRIPLATAVAREGFLKLSFLYSGAATQDRCIDVRYVGDSITIRSESAVEFEIGVAGFSNITATAALMPKDVAVLLSNPAPPPSDIAAALTLARSLTATGRHVTFYHGIDTMPGLVEGGDKRRWTHGLIVVGAFNQIADRLDVPITTVATAMGSVAIDNMMATARIGGVPILLITDPASARTGRLVNNPSLSALRDTPLASVGQVAVPGGPTDRISFDALGLVPVQAEVFGRADLVVAIPSRTLPGGTSPARLVLDIMVAPDGAGEKAVVSVFVNERLLASRVAAIGEPTQLDFMLPDGLVGSVANIRVVIQRRSSQGDCRFEPQGYPAEILGSSAVILSEAGSIVHDFSDLATLWVNGIEVLVPSSTSEHPLSLVASLANILNAITRESTPITVKYLDGGAPAPGAPFIAVSNTVPVGAEQRVHFDRGRVAVTDRAGNSLLDIGGLATGAVAQIVTSNTHPGLWIKPLGSDGSLPASPAVNLDRGDVAFLDRTGIALALSTERDTLLRISYADSGSWLTNLDRFRSWIVGGVWALITLVLIFVLQRIYRRRHAAAAE